MSMLQIAMMGSFPTRDQGSDFAHPTLADR